MEWLPDCWQKISQSKSPCVMSSGRRPRTKNRVEECASVSLDGISISLDVL